MPDQSSAATEHAILQEITAPLEALPDDPLASVDADFPTTLRGYDRLAVDDYVRRTRQLVAELQATRTPESAVRRALERVGEQISGILQRAHETAEQITAQSRREAEDRLELARAEAAQIMGAAEARVRELDADTDRIWLERQRIVADAEDLAGQLVALAKEAAGRFPEDVEAEAATEPAELGASAEELEAAEFEPQLDPAEHPAPAPELEPVEHPEPEPEPTGSDFDAPADEEPDRVDDEPPPSYEKSEIERTLSFKPLARDAGGEEVPPAPEEAPAAPQPQPPAPGNETDVIPPASQAANRRQSS